MMQPVHVNIREIDDRAALRDTSIVAQSGGKDSRFVVDEEEADEKKGQRDNTTARSY